MEFQKGQIVKSLCGRDKNRYYMVCFYDGTFVEIADGKIHKLEKAKRKNSKHLSKTQKYITMDAQTPLTNKQLRRQLAVLNQESPVSDDKQGR